MLQKQFENYLSLSGISVKSLRNYRSDLSHFCEWAILKLKSFGSYISSLDEIIPFLTSDFADEYKKFMVENSSPNKTVNRRLSTLRRLSRFLIEGKFINSDFMLNIPNISQVKKTLNRSASLIGGFTAHLEAQKVSKNTIKNYQSDIRQFLIWLENNHADLA